MFYLLTRQKYIIAKGCELKLLPISINFSISQRTKKVLINCGQ